MADNKTNERLGSQETTPNFKAEKTPANRGQKEQQVLKELEAHKYGSTQERLNTIAGSGEPEQTNRDPENAKKKVKDFDLGEKLSPEEIDKILGQVIINENHDIEDLSGGQNNHLDTEGSLEYRRRAFALMANKYGKERMQQFTDFLANSFPEKYKVNNMSREKIFTSYSHELPQMRQDNYTETKKEMNKRLNNIADSLKEGQLENLTNLFGILRKEDYNYKYDFTWNPATVNRLLENPTERANMIEYQNHIFDASKGGAAYLKMKNELGKDALDEMTYTQRLNTLRLYLPQ